MLSPASDFAATSDGFPVRFPAENGKGRPLPGSGSPRPVLLLDEPFAALDPGLRAAMVELLADLHVNRIHDPSRHP